MLLMSLIVIGATIVIVLLSLVFAGRASSRSSCAGSARDNAQGHAFQLPPLRSSCISMKRASASTTKVTRNSSRQVANPIAP